MERIPLIKWQWKRPVSKMKPKILLQLLLVTLIGISAGRTAKADDLAETASNSSAEAKGVLNVSSPTFGGKQFWNDELVFHDWRVQRNVISGHCRLLDDQNVRRAWGEFDECLQ